MLIVYLHVPFFLTSNTEYKLVAKKLMDLSGISLRAEMSQNLDNYSDFGPVK